MGFVMLSDGIPPGNLELHGPYYLWRLLIDHRHQRRGFGTLALDLCVSHVHQHADARELLASVVQAPGSPLPFHLGFGFESMDKVVDNELLLWLPLQKTRQAC